MKSRSLDAAVAIADKLLSVQATEARMMGQSGFFKFGEGRTYQLGNASLAFKPVDGLGDYSVWESIGPAGSGAGLHRHGYDEWHVIIEGRFECQVGDELRVLGPGDMMFAPAGTAHAIKNIGPGEGRQMGISSPAGAFEAFIADVVNSQADSGDPSRRASATFKDIAAKHGVEFIEA